MRRASRIDELASAIRLARRRVDAQREKETLDPLGPMVELGSSADVVKGSALSERVLAIDVKLGEISAVSRRLASMGVTAATSDGAQHFERAIEHVERDCTWTEAAIGALEGLSRGVGSRQRSEHERQIGATLRYRLADLTKLIQSCAVERGKLLQQRQKRHSRFAHSGPAISTKVQLNTPLFAQKTPPPPPPPPPQQQQSQSRPAAATTFAAPANGLRARKKTGEEDQPTRLKIQQEQQQQQMRLEETSRRRLDVAHNVESEIGRLGDLFGRFASLVAQQSEVVQRLDDDVEGALYEVEAGHAEVSKAQKILKGNRSLMIKVFGVTSVLILLFVYF